MARFAPLAAILLSCDKGLTGPGASQLPVLAFAPVYDEAAALAAIPVSKVRVTLLRQSVDVPIALDTVIDYANDADSMFVTIEIPLLSLTGTERLGLKLAMTNAAGDTFFRAGPTPVTVSVPVDGAPAPAPTRVPVRYVGTGANAARIVLATHSFPSPSPPCAE